MYQVLIIMYSHTFIHRQILSLIGCQEIENELRMTPMYTFATYNTWVE